MNGAKSKGAILTTAGWLCILGMLALTGCQAAEEPSPTAMAERLFRQNCALCHGANLDGRGGPNLQQVGARLSKEQIAETIRKGADGMPAFTSLAAEELEALAVWLADKK